jgi:hypothetical protein
MKNTKIFTFALAALLGTALTSTQVFAHGDCPMCSLPVVDDTAKVDYEVELKSGKKTVDYRCVYCALADAGEYKGDITVMAPSETKGKKIAIKRVGGKWSAPAGTVFVAAKVKHNLCQSGYRAFSSRKAFDAWAKNNQATLKGAKPINLTQMLKVAAA